MLIETDKNEHSHRSVVSPEAEPVQRRHLDKFRPLIQFGSVVAKKFYELASTWFLALLVPELENFSVWSIQQIMFDPFIVILIFLQVLSILLTIFKVDLGFQFLKHVFVCRVDFLFYKLFFDNVKCCSSLFARIASLTFAGFLLFFISFEVLIGLFFLLIECFTVSKSELAEHEERRQFIFILHFYQFGQSWVW